MLNKKIIVLVFLASAVFAARGMVPVEEQVAREQLDVSGFRKQSMRELLGHPVGECK